ncbi:hypothetical protein NVP1273O_05 [Vibrio phage 1.273.O._10N.286.54.C7]|nr:hypothetical protein NVP1273O_05 [Vibrio phage 1.273.O._10N.286.54.C7]
MGNVFDKYKTERREITREEIDEWESKPCICGERSEYKLTISGDSRDLRLCKKHHANLLGRNQTLAGVKRIESIHYRRLNLSMLHLKVRTFNQFSHM